MVLKIKRGQNEIMGVDIYLEWDNQTQEEHDAQITGFSIDAGAVGYLRASYGMGEELKILHEIFPDWDNKPTDFDWVFALDKAKKLIRMYAIGKDIEFKNMWGKSLINFLELGIKLRKEGKHPTFYISY